MREVQSKLSFKFNNTEVHWIMNSTWGQIFSNFDQRRWVRS